MFVPDFFDFVDATANGDESIHLTLYSVDEEIVID